ncbi:hypothetical protein Tco_0812329 [Tanacetum coccineum]
MAAPITSISSDSSEQSVSSHAPRVILFGAIPPIIPIISEVPIVPADPIVAPEVGTVSVISPSRVLDLVDYSSSSDSDPSEDSLPPVPDLPIVSPFLCSDDSEADSESEPAEQRPVRIFHKPQILVIVRNIPLFVVSGENSPFNYRQNVVHASVDIQVLSLRSILCASSVAD